MSSQSSNRMLSPAEAAALEARFGLRVTAHLHQASAQLPHDVSERLRVARLQAVERARKARLAQTAPAHAAPALSVEISAQGAGRMSWSDPETESPWWMRLGILIPLLLLVIGLVGIEQWRADEQIRSAAEIDAALLGDDLPPAAYADPGFAEFVLDASTSPRE